MVALQELGTLLGVTAEKAEQVAADMIMEGRLSGVIDQVGRKGVGGGVSSGALDQTWSIWQAGYLSHDLFCYTNASCQRQVLFC